ncbi:short-chain dehydrogenase [Longimycelium tulufanense]|uniref:Short-chain dehydrogenase n=1 Tax=Longimycelium tulufanense TaxID=907463 RepID=A0A8J3FUD0_9PSEU|nr:SDR family NAD(P)-dependent oxidoreductase [Longimycelium tulufanense]GGM53944.1 short-chain dehydrogenase [Longimycelium tulufanense]
MTGPVLVTGASRGIGRAVAQALAAAGHDLVLWSRSAGELAGLAEQVAAHGVAARVASVDVGDADQVAAAAHATLDPTAGLGGVVLNAGGGRWSPLPEIELADWRNTIATNLDGAFHTLRAALPLLTARPGGLLVGLLSDSVLHPFPGRAAYSAAKSGMRALLEVARRELRPHGVRVSLLLPSRVDTYFQGAHDEARPGTRADALSAEQVADVVTYLFGLPVAVELREVQLAAMTTTFGPFPERVCP